MKSAVVSGTLLIMFAIFLVSHAEDNSSDDGSTGGSEEQEVKFCNDNTTAEERNTTLVCVLKTENPDAERLKSYMEMSKVNSSVIADLLCNNEPEKIITKSRERRNKFPPHYAYERTKETNLLNEQILESEGKNLTTGEEPELTDTFRQCEAQS
uniref:14 kDa family member n=1 Tax=Rhipicephalus zambeziensis TaxID=60191 RepID=A0A224YBG5_9ACAR